MLRKVLFNLPNFVDAAFDSLDFTLSVGFVYLLDFVFISMQFFYH